MRVVDPLVRFVCLFIYIWIYLIVADDVFVRGSARSARTRVQKCAWNDRLLIIDIVFLDVIIITIIVIGIIADIGTIHSVG